MNNTSSYDDSKENVFSQDHSEETTEEVEVRDTPQNERETVYRCTICKVNFTVKSTFDRHNDTLHEVSREVDKCETCKMVFPTLYKTLTYMTSKFM